MFVQFYAGSFALLSSGAFFLFTVWCRKITEQPISTEFLPVLIELISHDDRKRAGISSTAWSTLYYSIQVIIWSVNQSHEPLPHRRVSVCRQVAAHWPHLAESPALWTSWIPSLCLARTCRPADFLRTHHICTMSALQHWERTHDSQTQNISGSDSIAASPQCGYGHREIWCEWDDNIT